MVHSMSHRQLLLSQIILISELCNFLSSNHNKSNISFYRAWECTSIRSLIKCLIFCAFRLNRVLSCLQLCSIETGNNQIVSYTGQLENFISSQNIFDVKRAFSINHVFVHFAELLISQIWITVPLLFPSKYVNFLILCIELTCASSGM